MNYVIIRMTDRSGLTTAMYSRLIESRISAHDAQDVVIIMMMT